jgi:hypothetical protein
VVVDLPPHRRDFAKHGLVEIGRMGLRRAGQHRQRRLERMGEVAGVAAGFLGLGLGMGEQRVQFLDHRLHLEREGVGHAVGAGRADVRDRLADVSQRPEAVPGLQHGHDE